jgi:hypothetical protein
MRRLTNRQHQRAVTALMSIYVALLLVVWPLARGSDVAVLKILYALAPVLPILGVIALMARKIADSDELEQRTHLLALGFATAVVSIFALIGGFLAAAKVFNADMAAMLLLWVFPVLMLSYAGARGAIARRYGGSACDDDGAPQLARCAGAAALIGLVAAYAYFCQHDDYLAGVASGIATGLGGAALLIGLNRWRRQRRRVAE